MRTLTRMLAVLAGVIGLTLAAPASAQNTLDEILKRGKILVGMDLAAPPFA